MDLSYTAQGRMAMLRQRAKRCVCKYCGGRLSIRQIQFSDIDDARIELFCKHCDKIEFGVEPEIYQSAAYFAEEMGFDYYRELDKNEQTKKMNIAKLCEIMAWQDKNLGILSREGFTVPLNANPNVVGECLILEDCDLEAIEEIVLGNQ